MTERREDALELGGNWSDPSGLRLHPTASASQSLFQLANARFGSLSGLGFGLSGFGFGLAGL